MEVRFFVQATRDHQQQFKALVEQRNAVDAALKALHSEVSKYPKIALAREIAGSSGPFSVEIQNSGSVAVVASLYEVAPATPIKQMKTRPAFYIDPATMNLLLNSKLLDDEQKKKLLVAVNESFEGILGIKKEEM